MKISIIGTGPGSRSLITPLANQRVDECDVIIGGKRNLAAFELEQKEQISITGDLTKIVDYIKNNKEYKKIGVLASGDPCFYGITGYLKQFFLAHELSIIPGISCFQYLACKEGLVWENGALCSLHGRQEDVLSKIKNFPLTFILTGTEWTPQKIAAFLCEKGLEQISMIIGSRLSYEDEKIVRGTAKELALLSEQFTLALTAVLYE